MRRLIRVFTVLVILIAIVLGAGTGFVIYTTRRMLPQVSGVLNLAGLDGPVSVYRDAAGVPHIYASTTHDLFFAQGVVQAQDRWWQMEFNRHTGLGRISELTGRNTAALDNDIFIRTVGWNRAAARDLEVLGDETRRALESYSAGVNAYLEGRSGADLAVEYSMLGIRGVNIPIEPWEPLHSVAWAKVMAWALSGNAGNELTAAGFIRELGESDGTAFLTYYNAPYPADHPTILIEEDLPVEAAPVSVRRAPALAPGTDLAAVQTALIGTPPDLSTFFGGDSGLGSNNWVVGGSLTQSGMPLLANDPHLGIQMPSIWYQNGLHCVEVTPECPYDVVGFVFPGAPGVVIGHNGRIAWGVTNGTLDTQDLYVIDVDPEDDTRYRIDDEWQTMDVITETIRFGDGGEPHTVRVRETRFGPIVTDTPAYEEDGEAFGRPLALRWAALSEPGDLLGSVLAINRASDWDSFRAALTGWVWPAQNFVYADMEGNIGYQLPGLIPIRAGDHSGTLPVDGTTSAYDWRGFIPFEYLPHVFNPARGYIVTANNAIVPDAYYAGLAEALGDQFGLDANYRISVQWDYGYRAARITQMIEAHDAHTVQTIAGIQGDNLDLTAAQLLPAVLDLDFGTDVPAEVISWMRDWDYQAHMNSGQAALYAAFWARLAELLWADEAGFIPSGSNISWGTHLLMAEPDHRWWDNRSTPDQVETRDDILRAAFVGGYRQLVDRLGSDFRAWRWGALHTARFVSNPLGASGIGLIEDFVNAGPVAVSGSAETINRTGWSTARPYATGSLSSMRMIVDMADLENSRWIHTTGQSGHPSSIYYREQIDRWRLIEYDSMRFDRSAIQRAAINTLTLEPR